MNLIVFMIATPLMLLIFLGDMYNQCSSLVVCLKGQKFFFYGVAAMVISAAIPDTLATILNRISSRFNLPERDLTYGVGVENNPQQFSLSRKAKIITYGVIFAFGLLLLILK